LRFAVVVAVLAARPVPLFSREAFQCFSVFDFLTQLAEVTGGVD
jgi:hypothetical protein